MKRIIILVLGVLILQNVIAQPIIISHTNSNYFVDTRSFDLKSELPSGYYRVYYDSLKTKLDYEGEISNNKRIDKWTWYFETGSKRREIVYSNGVYNGEVISYYPNGEKSASIYYSMGVQDGTFKRYHENGNIRLEGSYLNGQPSGTWVFYNEDGQKLKEEQH